MAPGMTAREHARERAGVFTVEIEDLEALEAADGRYAEASGVEQVVNRSSVHFYRRSGHSFVAREGGEVRGFVLAHASWSGGRPVVRVERLVGGEEVAPALVEAVVKSAYDAGVYDIVATLPRTDVSAHAAFDAAAFRPLPVSVVGRVLGSRGSQGETAARAIAGVGAGTSGEGG